MVKIDLTPVVRGLQHGTEALGNAFHRIFRKKGPKGEPIIREQGLVIYQNHPKKKYESSQYQCNQVTNISAKILNLLYMVPLIQIAISWYRERKKRIINLQNQCIEKAEKEVMEKMNAKIMQLFFDTMKRIEELKEGNISDEAKQYYQDCSISTNKETAATIRETAEIKINTAHIMYRANWSEEMLKKELTKSFVTPYSQPSYR